MAYLICGALWQRPVPAGAALVLYDGFEAGSVGGNIAGTLPEIGRAPWTVVGDGTAARAIDGTGVAMDVQTDASTGYVPVGPDINGERWIRVDFPSEVAAGVLITPQLQTGLETNASGLPGVWPAVPGNDAWAVVNTAFMPPGGGGSASPAQLNLAQLYPQCDRDIPFHMEMHWKVRPDDPRNADMAIRIWNGDLPPEYAGGASVVYTLADGAFRLPARSAISKVGNPSLASAISLFDARPEVTVLPATSDAFSYSGRWVAFGTEMHASGAGQRVRFRATGDSCTLLFRCDTASFLPVSWRVDGGPWTRSTLLGGGNVELPLYSGRSWGPHTVDVIASAVAGLFWSSDDTRLVFRGIRLPPGGSAGPLPWGTHKAVFIGDSISCGYLVNGHVSGQPSNLTSDARLAPAALLSDWLGWDTTNISIPGIGFAKPYIPGKVPPLVAQTFFEQPFPGVEWQPADDVSEVIINLGTMDGNSGLYPDSEVGPAVVSYLNKIHAQLPSARIYMLTPFIGSRFRILKSAFESAAIPGSEWVETTATSPDGAWINLTKSNPNDTWTPDTTDTAHPSVAGDEKVARRLMDVLGADGGPVANLDFPVQGQTVSGTVLVMGSARGAGFSGGTLEYGVGDSPTAWRRVHAMETPLSNTQLGVWDTRALTPGRYTLRLVASAERGTAVGTASVTVVPDGVSGGATPTESAMALKAGGGLISLPPATSAFLDVLPVPGMNGRPVGNGSVDIEDAVGLLLP